MRPRKDSGADGRRATSGSALLRAGCVVVVGTLASACSTASFAQLVRNVSQVPVPEGVTLIRADHSTDGNGVKEAVRVYRSTWPCEELKSRWIQTLRAAGRSFEFHAYPKAYVGSGYAVIVLTDRPGHLVINLGNLASSGDWAGCARPLVSNYQ